MRKLSFGAKGILLSLLLILPSVKAWGQEYKQLPLDPKTHIGHLPNGLTYFIRHNEKPEGRADFYIAQKVGSILEKDSQSGLAHFLEHMAFNGTKNFPNKDLLNYLQGLGCTFGAEINAYTSFDRTVYNIDNVPVKRQSVVDSCILILHDWSNAITLADKEIDNERGVIQEEWRSRNSAGSRVHKSISKQLVPNSLYTKRYPIGDMNVVRNFKYQELRDYYKKWYRPDLQALIIVGDIDVKQVEASIKRIFADVPKPVNPAKRIYQKRYPKADKPVIAIATDPELRMISMQIGYRMPEFPKELGRTEFRYRTNVENEYIQSILSERFSEIMHKPNPPYLGAGYYVGTWGSLLPDDNTRSFGVAVKAGEEKKGFNALIREIKKVRDYGFTEAELERARKKKLRANETYLTRRADWKNGAHVNTALMHFIEDGHWAGLVLDTVDYKMSKKWANAITLDQLNAKIKKDLNSSELMLVYRAPKADSIQVPTKVEYLAMYKEAMKQEVQAPEKQEKELVLMTKTPKAGRIVKEEKGKYDSKIWHLSNGARVIFKITDFKADAISMSANRQGGTLPYFGKEDIMSIRTLPSFLNMGGLANFDNQQLSKILTGHQVGAGLYVSNDAEGVYAHSIKDDMEMMFQLIYLNMTAKRKDNLAFANWKKRMLNHIEGAKKSPTRGFSDTIQRIATTPERYEYIRSYKEADIEKVDYDKVMQLQKKIFNGVDGMTFYFIGTIDEAKFRPLVETYIASLPRGKKVTSIPYEKLQNTRKGRHINHFANEMQTPKTYIFDCFTQSIPFSRRKSLLSDIMGEVIKQTYTEVIREREGGAYSVGVSSGLSIHNPSKEPIKAELSLVVSFPTDPEKAEKMNKLVREELDKICKEGMKQDFFEKTIKSYHKKYQEQLKENSYWLNRLIITYGDRSHIDPNFYKQDIHKVLDGIKKSEVEAMLKGLLASDNYIEVVLSPKPKKAK